MRSIRACTCTPPTRLVSLVYHYYRFRLQRNFTVMSKEPIGRRRNTAFLLILTVMWILTTIRTAMTWHFIVEVYIVHGGTREEMFDENIDPNSSTVKMSIFWGVALAVNAIIAECVMVSVARRLGCETLTLM